MGFYFDFLYARFPSEIKQGAFFGCGLVTLCHTESLEMASLFKFFLANIDREAWLRFFFALAGVSLAFAAAIFSSAASGGGNAAPPPLFASTPLPPARLGWGKTVAFHARRAVSAPARGPFQHDVP